MQRLLNSPISRQGSFDVDSETATKWFYSAGNDRKGPFSRDQISALLSAGVLNAHSRVWSEATTEWTPLFRTELRSLLGGRDIAPPEIELPAAETTTTFVAPAKLAQPAPASTRTYDNRLLGTVLYWALNLNAFIQVIPVAAILKGKKFQDKVDIVRLFENESVVNAFGLVFVATILLFLIWCYRATTNAFRVAGPQSVTPWGAVYWNFVPVAWFWKPYEAMRNLHRAFVGTDDQRLLMQWWGAWWGSLAIAVLSMTMQGPGGIDQAANAEQYLFWTLAVCAADAASFYLAGRLVRQLSKAEADKMGVA